MLEVPEVVINIVDYDMVQQTSLASCEYDQDINEFVKAGFTMQPATIVQPPMVKEAKVKISSLSVRQPVPFLFQMAMAWFVIILLICMAILIHHIYFNIFVIDNL